MRLNCFNSFWCTHACTLILIILWLYTGIVYLLFYVSAIGSQKWKVSGRSLQVFQCCHKSDRSTIWNKVSKQLKMVICTSGILKYLTTLLYSKLFVRMFWKVQICLFIQISQHSQVAKPSISTTNLTTLEYNIAHGFEILLSLRHPHFCSCLHPNNLMWTVLKRCCHLSC